jgi:very-long-chain enoyl-CoA reductase
VPSTSSTYDLYKQIASSSGFDINRLRITDSNDGKYIPNAKDVTISSLGLSSDATIAVKDLGPQIAWRTVFIIEYLGPILIHPLIYFARPYIYPTPSFTPTEMPAPSQLQTLTMALIILHFLKREYETLFIHRFSLSTMPFLNIFKNSAHYWLLSGLNIAYWTYAPTSVAQSVTSLSFPDDRVTAAGIALFVVGELANLETHIVLRELRGEGTTERGIPKGLGFNFVTCPNYFFETVSWIGITLVSRSLSTWLFVLVAGAQMALWGQKKEERYRKEFGDKYVKKRYVMIPWVI